VLPPAAKTRLICLTRLLAGTTEDHVTSHTISQWTGWTRATIRKDISQLGVSCGAAKGYNCAELRAAVRERLNLGAEVQRRRCCIVGLGLFGETLLRYEGFKNSAFCIAAGFDQSVNRAEILTADFPLYPASRLEEIIQKERIEYAILATPEETAAGIAKRLCGAGIKGIVNCTAAALPVGSHTKVENISVITALENLSSQVNL
jgi:redox-sensing transcriptional repressor